MIIIPGFDMPRTCEECPCMNDGSCYAIPDCMREDPYDYMVGFYGRQTYCPLIEVKPGIRIIRKKKTATIQELKEMYDGPCLPMPKGE